MRHPGVVTSLPYDNAPPLVDGASVATLLAELTEASAALARAATVPPQIRELVRALPRRLHAEAPTNALTGDPYLAENAFAGAARAAAALLNPEPHAARKAARLALEQIRQALRDIVEAGPVDEDVPPARVAAWLEGVLGVPQAQVAELVGTSARTWQRWLTGTTPDPYLLARLRRIARLTMHLRHALTGPGVARWFTRPHPLIKDSAGCPADLLDDPDGYRRLLVLAAGLRSTQAS
jgi:hypothetical protein